MVTPDPESETPNYEAYYANALKNLQNEDVRERLASLVATYMFVVQPIIIEASIQKAGVRPAGLENEIYSCFHHIARGLCVTSKKEETKSEIDRGESSHLKRVLLDSYKVAIGPCLEEYQFIIADLYQLSLDKDFNPDIYGADPIAKIKEVLKIKADVKKDYQDAKRNESLGNTVDAIEAYDAALIGCGKLKIAINDLMKEDVYSVAKAHAARKQAEKDESRKEDRLNNRVTWIIAIAALIVAACSWLFPREKGTNGTLSQEQPSTAAASPAEIAAP